jgi:uncharacterized membrane protein
VTDPAVYLPALMGIIFFVAGVFTYRRELLAASSRGVSGLVVMGPTFVAASLAAFSGEHFTAAKGMATLVPKWMPAPLFITYFVGVAHLAAALSLVARRCVRWAAVGLATMFAIFVLTLYVPSAMRHPEIRMVWIFPFREGTFAMGGVALFASAVKTDWPGRSITLATVTRYWTALALIFFGIQNVLYPQFRAGVPDNVPPSQWVPFPQAISYVVGFLLVIFGALMLIRKYAIAAGASAGLLMLLLTLLLFVPDFLMARNVEQYVTAINFIADTLLFGGAVLLVAGAQDESFNRAASV